ncbi:MAG: hypothetical protein ACRCVG_07180 [Methanobacteriaceae archaeon]
MNGINNKTIVGILIIIAILIGGYFIYSTFIAPPQINFDMEDRYWNLTSKELTVSQNITIPPNIYKSITLGYEFYKNETKIGEQVIKIDNTSNSQIPINFSINLSTKPDKMDIIIIETNT